jgi:hypothetical protein
MHHSTTTRPLHDVCITPEHRGTPKYRTGLESGERSIAAFILDLYAQLSVAGFQADSSTLRASVLANIIQSFADDMKHFRCKPVAYLKRPIHA